MTQLKGQQFWLIGASSGIGEALIDPLLAEGVELIISARSEDKLSELAEGRQNIRPVTVDITQPQTIRDAIAEIGRVPDIICLMAGDYTPMAPDEFDAELFSRLTDVNYLGAVRVLAEALPEMRARGSGTCFITASLSGVVGLPGAAPYSAGKAALINLAESMQGILARDGVDLRLINPGFVKTRLTGKNTFPMPFLMEPDAAAEAIVRGMKRGRFDIRFPWQMSVLIRLLSALPYAVYLAVARRMVQS